MNPLKFALGKDEGSPKKNVSSSMKTSIHKSKSESIWTIDADNLNSEGQQTAEISQLGPQLLEVLQNSFANQSQFSQDVFYEVIESLQSQYPLQTSELNFLLLIEKELKTLIKGVSQNFKGFAEAFYQTLVKKIKKIQKGRKKEELQEYDRIIHNKFKKKGGPVQYIDENDNKKYLLNMKSKEKKKGAINSQESSSKKSGGSSKSSEDKLTKLLASQKLNEEKFPKKETEEYSAVNQHSTVSFSQVVSQSTMIRQRRGSRGHGKKETKKQQQQAQTQEKDSKDEAFIFYRPKKKHN